MRSNYHSIKAIINNSHGYSEMIHGITAYTQGLFRANVIKIKNTVVTKLRIGLKTITTSGHIMPVLQIQGLTYKQ